MINVGAETRAGLPTRMQHKAKLTTMEEIDQAKHDDKQRTHQKTI